MRCTVLAVLGLTLSSAALAEGICPFPETIFGDYPGDQLGCSVAAGEGVVAFGANMANGGTGSVTLLPGPALLLAGDGAPGDQFGFAASFDGDTLAVGAPTADLPGGRDAGAVYLFRKDGARWSQEAKLTAGDASSGAQFGFSVVLQGNTLVVGAPMDSARGSLSGAVYVFERTASGWSQRAKLAGSQVKPFDEFGLAVALDGGTLVAGAPFADGRAGGNQGAVYAFTGSGSNWTETQVLTAAPAAAGDELGFAVALSGGTLAVGARRGDVAGSADAGWVAVFKNGEGGWQENARLTAGDAAQAGALFGGAVALDDASGSRKLLVGAALASNGNGAAFLFMETAGGGWQLQEPLRPDATQQGRYGFSVAMHGGDAVVGAFMAQRGKGTAVCGQARLTPTAAASAAACNTVGLILTVTNQGITGAERVQVRVPAPKGLTPVPPTDQRCGIVSGDIVCALGGASPGGPVEVSFGVPQCYGGENPVKLQVFKNSESSPSASIAVPVVCKADLAVEKTGPPTVAPGGSLPYSLKVTNLGPDPACGVSLKDPFPPSLGPPTVPCCLGNSNEVQFLKDKLSPGESSTFAITFTVPAAAACGSQIVNTASVTASTPDRQTRNNSATVTTTVTSPLAISKTDGLTTAMPGQGLFYTIAVSNPGPCAVTGAKISDVSPPGLAQTLWCRGPACTPTRQGDLLDTLSLPPGGSETYHVSGVVSDAFDGPLINTAMATAPAGAVSASDTTDIGFTGVKAFCDGLQGAPSVGGTMTYTFLLINRGPFAQADNPGDEFTDALPAGLTLTSVTVTSGTPSSMGNTAKWNGPIPVGRSVTITITAMVNAGPLGMTLFNQATIAFDADGNGTNESARFSDDPGQPGLNDPCSFVVSPSIPALSGPGLAALALLLACVALLRLRSRPV